jgi:hypothetical protein
VRSRNLRRRSPGNQGAMALQSLWRTLPVPNGFRLRLAHDVQPTSARTGIHDFRVCDE